MTTYSPYTYRISWTSKNVSYYGLRLKPKAEHDIWVYYFTSSYRVKELRKEFGEPDLIEIRKTFNNEDDARKWEAKVLRRLKVLHKTSWLNNYSGTYHGSTKPKSLDHRRKISAAHLGKNRPYMQEANRNPEKIRKTAEWHKGKKRPKETGEKISAKRKELIERNGGKNLNHGHKQYYDPSSPKENHIQCHPDNKPLDWVEGNWMAATTKIGTVMFNTVGRVIEYELHQQTIKDYCYMVVVGSKTKIRKFPFSDRNTYVKAITDAGHTVILFN